jgi:hypothetical protein
MLLHFLNLANEYLMLIVNLYEVIVLVFVIVIDEVRYLLVTFIYLFWIFMINNILIFFISLLIS